MYITIYSNRKLKILKAPFFHHNIRRKKNRERGFIIPKIQVKCEICNHSLPNDFSIFPVYTLMFFLKKIRGANTSNIVIFTKQQQKKKIRKRHSR